MSFGDIVTGVGQAVQDLYGHKAASAEANSFTGAATLATQNAQLTAASTRIQDTQLARQIFQSEGTQITDVAGAGFTGGGSALDLLRSSASQGALAKAVNNIQGAVTENAYAQQAGSLMGQAAAAKENANASTVGAIGAIGGALLNGSGSLVSAGKTVVNGVNYVSDALFGTGLNAANYVGASPATQVASDIADAVSSGTDSYLSSGSELFSDLGSTSFGVDTSGLSVGTSLSDAYEGISNYIGGVSDSISDAVGGISDYLSSGVSGLEDLIGVGDIGLSGLTSFLGPIGIGLTIASFIPGVGDVINDAESAVTGFVGDAVGGAVDAVSNFFGSVICTAYYRQGFIPRRTWLANQRYGVNCNRTVYRGYHIWAKPIAEQITKRPWLAKLLWPIFKAPILQIAAERGVGKSTYFGRVASGIFTSFSYLVGVIYPKGVSNAYSSHA